MTPEIPSGYGLDTKLRKAHFLAQLAHESGGAVPAFSDATNWRRVTDRAIVS